MMMTMEVMMKMMMTTRLHIQICIRNTFLAIFISFRKTPAKKKKKKKKNAQWWQTAIVHG